MKVIFTESQIRYILNQVISEEKKEVKELSKNSTGVQEFIRKVRETPGLLSHLDFKKISDLENFIYDHGYQDFQELKSDAKKFKEKD